MIPLAFSVCFFWLCLIPLAFSGQFLFLVCFNCRMPVPILKHRLELQGISHVVSYGVESVPKITGLREPPAFRWSPTFSRPHGFRVRDIPHVNALSVPKIRCLRGSPTFQRSHSFRRPHDLFIFLRLIGCLTYN